MRRRTAIIAVALAGLFPAFPALSQTVPTVPPKSVVGPRAGAPSVAAIQARRDFLFASMLARPGDLDVRTLAD